MPSDLAARQCCVRCRLRPEVCVCAIAPRLVISTRLVVVAHSKEWHRSSNTGYLAGLALRDGEVRLHGLPRRPLDTSGIDAASPSTLVLYPGRGAETLSPQYLESLPRPLTLLVPDGNWTQAKNMMRRVPMLSQARPVRLEGSTLELQCLRRNFYADRMSTFEAIALALGILEDAETAERLLAFFRLVLSRIIPNQRRTMRSMNP